MPPTMPPREGVTYELVGVACVASLARADDTDQRSMATDHWLPRRCAVTDAAISCDNCRRIVQPPPARVVLMVEGRLHSERRLCSACRVHVSDEFMRPAPWIGPPPQVKVRP